MSVKIITVSCVDLARVLDWCASTHYTTDAGTRIRITDDPYYYGDAYQSLTHELRRQLRKHGGTRHV